MNFIGAWTYGEERLWKPFWLGGLVGGIIWSIIIAIAELGGVYVTLLFQILYLIYSIWILVCVWRCAFNVDWVGWGYIARALTILSVVSWAALIVFAVFVIATVA